MKAQRSGIVVAEPCVARDFIPTAGSAAERNAAAEDAAADRGGESL